MIYQTPPQAPDLARHLAELDDLRERLGDAAQQHAGRWLGRLRRQWRASSASSSIEIEGFHAPPDAVRNLASGAVHDEADEQDRLALSSYVRAMDHVGVMSVDPQFRWLDRVLLDLHFDACYFQKDKLPGQYRTGPISVTSPRGGPPAYVGPSYEQILPLMAEMLDWLEHGNLDAHVTVRAAMAHLHVVSVHPFQDGNGRVSRIVQSLVLARGGLLAPEFLSIEEYLGRHTTDYYAALQEVQAGCYQPDRDAKPWVDFCVRAHIEQARQRLDQLEQAARRWSRLEQLVAERGWPERLVIALEQSLFDAAERTSYAQEAEVSLASATSDLRRLLDGGLLTRRGQGRNVAYVASELLRESIQ